MDIRLPDGRILRGVPEGTTKEQIMAKVGGLSAPVQKTQTNAPNISGTESLVRGAYSGAFQQPRDVIAAGFATLGGVPFKEGLAAAKEMSLEGRQGQAKEQNPGYFLGGEVGGNIALTLAPGMAATKAIGAAAPVLSKAPVIGNALSKTAQGISASKGLLGVPLAGAVQGGVSTLASDGDLSGALPGAIGAGAMGAVSKIARPVGTAGLSAAKKGYNAALEKIGVDLTAAQKTGSKTLDLVDSVLASMPFTAGAARDTTEEQLRKFTAAAMSKAGISGDDFTPVVREQAEAAFQKRYGDLINNEIVNIDQPVLDVVADISAKQLDKLPTNVKPIVQSYMRDIVQSGGKVSGEAYQEARSQLGQQAKSMAVSDPFTASVLKNLRNTLDEAAERSLPATKKGAWKELNRQYANYKTIQKSASNASENSLEGIISPKKLLQTVETANKTKGQKGYGDLYGLARAGSSVLADSVPNSGTAQRQLVQSILTGGGIGLGAGGITYGATQDPKAALGAALLSLGGPKAAQALINSPGGKRYLAEGLPGASTLATREAKALAAMLSAQSGE